MASILNPQAKLTRGNEHIQLLESELKPLTDTKAYAVTHEFDNNAGNHIWWLASAPPNIPLRASTIIGDALFNFRSALDHLVWQLVEANGKKPGRFNQFPIYRNPSEFKAKGKSQIKGVSKQAATIIQRLQKHPGRDSLMRLVRLNDIDKHRHLHLCVLSIGTASMQIAPNIGHEAHLGKVEYGTVLCTIYTRDMDVEYYPSFEIVFDESQGSRGPVLQGLKNIYSSVKHVIDSLQGELST